MMLNRSEIARRLKLEEGDRSRLRLVSRQSELHIRDYGVRLHLGDQFVTIESSSSLEPLRTTPFNASELTIHPSSFVLCQSDELVGLPVDLAGVVVSPDCLRLDFR